MGECSPLGYAITGFIRYRIDGNAGRVIALIDIFGRITPVEPDNCVPRLDFQIYEYVARMCPLFAKKQLAQWNP